MAYNKTFTAKFKAMEVGEEMVYTKEHCPRVRALCTYYKQNKGRLYKTKQINQRIKKVIRVN